MSQDADLILAGGKVITVDQAFSFAQAIAVKDDRIMAVGSVDEISPLAGEATTWIDLKGRAVIPGLIDGHAHMDREGLKSVFPSLKGATSIDDILTIIEGLAANSAPGAWIVTMPIGEPPNYRDVPNNLAEKRYPTRVELDRAAPDNPVYIRPIWGYWRHVYPIVSIANSIALALAGLDKNVQPPSPLVAFDRDPATGELTGVIRENMPASIAELTYFAGMPGFSHDIRVQGLKDSMQIYAATGTTGVYEGHGAAEELIQVYQDLHRAGDMIVRATLAHSPSWSDVDDYQAAHLHSAATRFGGRGTGDNWLRFESMHGALGLTAEQRLLAGAAPYTGWSGFNYDSGVAKERMIDYLVEAAKNDLRMSVIGMDFVALFAEVNKIVPLNGRRWVIAHMDRANSGEIERLAEMGIVMTLHTNHTIHGLTTDQITTGDENEIVPLKDMIDAGIHVALGTDNVPTSLFHPIWHCIARRNRHVEKTIGPDQSVSREQGLRAATNEGAYLTFEEDQKGSIEVGKLADLAVLSADPLTCAEDDIKDITADITLTGGRIVHSI